MDADLRAWDDLLPPVVIEARRPPLLDRLDRMERVDLDLLLELVFKKEKQKRIDMSHGTIASYSIEVLQMRRTGHKRDHTNNSKHPNEKSFG